MWFKPNETTIFSAWDFDYVVFPNDFFVINFQQYPDVFSRYHKIADNHKIAICTFSDTAAVTSIAQFLELKEKQFLLHERLSLDSEINEHWYNTTTSTETACSGITCGALLPERKWGIAYRTEDTEIFTVSDRNVFYSLYLSKESPEDTYGVALSIESSKGKAYSHIYYLKNEVPLKGNWNKIELLFQVPQLPKLTNEHYEMILHIFAPDEELHRGLYYDDIEFVIY